MTPFITACDRETAMDIIRMRDKGLSASNIARQKGISFTTLRRYIRVYDQYGPWAFIQTQEQP